DLLRRERRDGGVDLDLDGRRVRKRVDGEPRERDDPGRGDDRSEDEHEEAVLEGPGDDAVEHEGRRRMPRWTSPAGARFAASSADAFLEDLGLEEEAAGRHDDVALGDAALDGEERVRLPTEG